MPAQLADSLLALAASIDGDGGHAVCRTLSSLLRDSAPFDAGEVVLRHGGGFHRFPFGRDERPIAGEDLVNHVLTNGAPLRLDDARDLEPFAETRGRMAEGGLKSALVLPLGMILHVPASHLAASPNGVLVLARRHGWAFVGASLHYLGPLAAMAGMALDRALALTALGHPARIEAGADPKQGEALSQKGASLIAELQELQAMSTAGEREVETLRSTLALTRDELADARSATIAAQSALDQAVGRCHELQARLDRAEREPPKELGDAGSAPEPPAIGEAAPQVSAIEPALAPEAVATAPTTAPERQTDSTAPAAPSEPEGIEHAPTPVPSRRARRRRRGAFEPPGSPGTA
jgi:hypothetical protein